MYLSKSQYIRGLQCVKSLWLLKYKSQLQQTPPQTQMARFEAGDEVGELALQLFDCADKISFENSTFNEKIAQTKAFIDKAMGQMQTNCASLNSNLNTTNHKHLNPLNLDKSSPKSKNSNPALAEATFSFNGVLVMVDILQVTPQGLVLNEVKSATRVKDIYIDDLAVQYFVISKAGYSVIGANLVHINSAYERAGALDINALFCKVDLLEKVRLKQDEIKQNLLKFKRVLDDKENPPNVRIDRHCGYPYECDFKEFCWQNVPKENSIFELAGRKAFNPFEFYHKGVEKFSDIKDFSAFNAHQNLQIQCALKREVHIDKVAIKAFLDTLSYPIYHLDFEIFNEPVPHFDTQRPYMQVPFQYSLHIDFGNGKLAHKEFLASCDGDSRPALAQALVKDIPQNACILAYNASFERSVMKNLAEFLPEFKPNLENFCANLKDLMTPFKNKDFYHYKMKGSYSIKAVLPALVPQMEQAYHNLELIHNGGEAMDIYPKLKKMNANERKAYQNALLAYCKLDTLAMVEVLAKLKEVL